jgi:CheY-like chemotaxis protein
VWKKTVLIVEEDDARRRAWTQALAARGERALDVADGFAAMAALGRADFACVIAAEGRRLLSLRGLCQLARKRHPDIPIFIVMRVGSSPDELRAAMELPIEVLPDGDAAGLVGTVLASLASPPERTGTVRTDEFAVDIITDVDGAAPTSERSAPPPAVDLSELAAPGDAAEGAFDPPPRVAVPTIQLNDVRPPSRRLTSRLPTTVAGDAPAATPGTGGADDERPEPTQVDSLRPASSTQSAPAGDAIVVVDGHFEDIADGAGAALLMSLFAQELTGRLGVADGEACGTLFLHRGEPVWADDPEGDVGLYKKLVTKGFLSPTQPVEPVAEGALLGALMQVGLLDGERMHAFMREVVRDRVIAVATQAHGRYRFTEDRTFLDTAPLLKVNPFGLILDSRRRRLAPAALMALQGDLDALFPIPGPGLGPAAEKIRPFLRGARATEVIDGLRTVRAVLDHVGLDPFMGTLVFVVLRDARLVVLEAQPRALDVDLADGIAAAAVDITVVDDAAPGAPSSAEEARAREDIYALYLRLKPVTHPRQVLGVALDASDADVEAAYRARLAELDAARIPEGSAQHLLQQRVAELRRKVENAWQTLQVQDGHAAPGRNPF